LDTLEQQNRDDNESNYLSEKALGYDILIPSFNNSVYIPKATNTVNIAISPKTNFQLELQPDAPGIREIQGPHISSTFQQSQEYSREKRGGKTINDAAFDYLRDRTTFEDEWIGRSVSTDDLERKRRDSKELYHEESSETMSLEQLKQLEQEIQELRQKLLHHTGGGREKRGVLDGHPIMIDDLSQAKIDNDKQKYLQQEELKRGRRQSSDPDQLCPTVSQYIMPRAAVNADGDWMYVVNMPDEPEFQQFVRSEICISKNCRGLCSVPVGLKSQCSQQYVQKKLVALHPNGDKLVEDIFWFPSCCVCQVTQEPLEL
jgi:hypothetical protein